MQEPIYFSKVQFREVIGYGNMYSILLLNLMEGELSYQVYERKRQMPAITGMAIDENNYEYPVYMPAKVIRSAQSNFNPIVLPDDVYVSDVIFSHAVKLKPEQISQILPLCNALEFEPYRDKKMSMYDDGYIGYRDESRLYFTGITDSYIPKMEWSMKYYYDEEHIWPSEKLYRFLVMKYFKHDKKFRKWGPHYGAYSLFI